jgi:hypothetical protein
VTRVSIRRFDVIRAANIAAVLYAVIVLVFGLLFIPLIAIVGIAGVSTSSSSGVNVGAAMGGGIIGVLFLTLIAAVFYGIIGWIMTAIAVALFNVVAGRLGGLQADVSFESLPPAGGMPVPYGYPPGYGAQPTPYPVAGQGQPPTPPSNWGQPQS